MKKNMFLMVFILSFPLFQGCQNSGADLLAEPVSRLVKTHVVEGGSSFVVRRFPGVVKPSRETPLAFRVDGPLKSFDVVVGQFVRKGDIIAEVDDRDYLVRVDRLKASLLEAEANLKVMKLGARKEDIDSLTATREAAVSRLNEASRNFKRYSSLLKEGAVSQAAFDTAQSAHATARAEAEMALKNLEKAKAGARPEDIEAMEAQIRGISADLAVVENALRDTKLRAPFDGVVNRKLVEAYQFVSRGDHIVTFYDVSSPEITVKVPENIVSRMGGLKSVRCSLGLFPGKTISASLKEVGTSADAVGRSYPVTVTMDVPHGMEVLAGMAATVSMELPGEGISPGTFVPLAAVAAGPHGTPRVFSVDEATGTAVSLPVKTGRMTGGSIEIVSGLKAGDQIISAGARFLQPGQKVRVIGAKTGDDA